MAKCSTARVAPGPRGHRIVGSLPELNADRLRLFTDAARAERGETLEIAGEMASLTLRIVGETLLSTDVGGEASEVGEALRVLLHHTTESVSRLSLPESIPTRRNRRFHAALATLDGIILGMISERRRGRKAPDDLLTILMRARDEETGEGMSDRQLRDEALTI